MGQGAVMTITKEQAVELLQNIMDEGASHDPCYQANPDLWRVWCKIKGRDARPTDVWSEIDVIASSVLMLRKYINTMTVQSDDA